MPFTTTRLAILTGTAKGAFWCLAMKHSRKIVTGFTANRTTGACSAVTGAAASTFSTKITLSAFFTALRAIYTRLGAAIFRRTFSAPAIWAYLAFFTIVAFFLRHG